MEDLDSPFVVIVKTREEFTRWLQSAAPGLTCIQVEGLIVDPEVWALASQGSDRTPLDVLLADPAVEFSALYRLVDVRMVRPVRVTIPALPGLLKAVRLAASLQLPIRLLPGQPDSEVLSELSSALRFYLHDPMVEAPIEFFHTLLGAFRGMDPGTLWSALEQDPALFSCQAEEGKPSLPAHFVETHLAGLLEKGAECANCPWLSVCAGYFKLPDPDYSCDGIKQVFLSLEAAAAEISRDLEDLLPPDGPSDE